MPFPLADDGKIPDLYPAALKLKFVQVIHRHGRQRTPAHKYFAHIQPAGTWTQCKITPYLSAFHSFNDALVKPDTTSSPFPPHFNTVVMDPATHALGATSTVKSLSSYSSNGDGECKMGQLTDKGKETLTTAGANLRKLYFEKLKLLDDKENNRTGHKDIYLRSTDYARTIESLQYLLHGLHPAGDADKPSNGGDPAATAGLTIHVKSADEETLYPHHNCSTLNLLNNAFRKQLGAENSKRTTYLIEKFKHLGTDPSKPHLIQLHALYDIFACMDGAGVPLPKGIAHEDLDALEKITTEQWLGIYDDEKAASLGAGMALRDVKIKLMEAVNNTQTAVKMSIFSAHDTTVGPILSALRAWDRTYPDFGSMINLELFEEAQYSAPQQQSLISKWFSRPPPPQHYVRLLYNGKPVAIPACAAPKDHRGDDTTMCTLEAFVKRVDELVPKDYEAAYGRRGLEAPPVVINFEIVKSIASAASVAFVMKVGSCVLMTAVAALSTIAA
ncbi:hypothetical protein PhCBS80983_g01304 [Powellomyces hirtus]|uniref:Acid phosphatase n=1 Tax=Powellomyces hirtus TaxID=109895 RepID=A0A507EAW9_9FUNG|nr:hypothetical protein PhCBS80983_g01304 [Powellomyces hirtus]